VKDQQRNWYMTAVYAQMMADLQYPVAKDGSVMDASGIKAWVCWHLVRAGWRKPNNTDRLALREEYDDPVIKKRRVYGPGVFEDAVTWVDAAEPDDPLDNLQHMTVAEIEALPEDVRLEAKRRLGVTPAAPQADPQPAWTVQPYISITDAPDETTEWST
jgi:hypothetical protein